MSLLTTTARAVTGKLNATSFEPDFTAVRQYLPRHALDELGSLTVTVVPKAREMRGSTRGADQHDCQLDIAVQQKIAVGDDDAIDSLMALADQIVEAFRGWVFTEGDVTGRWFGTEQAPVYSVEHLEQASVFTSVITLQIRVFQ